MFKIDAILVWHYFVLINFDWRVPNATRLFMISNYRQVSNVMRTLVGNKIVDHSDVVGASPAGAAPTTCLLSI